MPPDGLHAHFVSVESVGCFQPVVFTLVAKPEMQLRPVMKAVRPMKVPLAREPFRRAIMFKAVEARYMVQAMMAPQVTFQFPVLPEF